MKRYKAAVIGLGHQGTEDWIPGIMNSQFATLEAVCDIDKKKLEAWKERLKVNAYENYKELLSKEFIDFVVVATPHDTHKPIIEEALKRGIHVLKEKPFARSLEEALYLRDLAKKYETTLMIVAQRRFNPIYTTFFQLKDQIGEPFFIEAKYTLFVEKPYKGWRGDRKKKIKWLMPAVQNTAIKKLTKEYEAPKILKHAMGRKNFDQVKFKLIVVNDESQRKRRKHQVFYSFFFLRSC